MAKTRRKAREKAAVVLNAQQQTAPSQVSNATTTSSTGTVVTTRRHSAEERRHFAVQFLTEESFVTLAAELSADDARDSDLIAAFNTIYSTCDKAKLLVEAAKISSSAVRNFFSMLLSRMTHDNGKVVDAAVVALVSLTHLKAGAECLASHPLIGNLFDLLSPFRPPCAKTSTSRHSALCVVQRMVCTTEGAMKKMVVEALVAKGFLGALTTLLAYKMVHDAPKCEALRKNSDSPQFGFATAQDATLPHAVEGADEAAGDEDAEAVNGIETLLTSLNQLLFLPHPLPMVAPLLPVLQHLMSFPDDSREIVELACMCATHIVTKSPQHRAACEAAGITARVVTLLKQATAAFLRASTTTRTAASLMGGGAVAVPGGAGGLSDESSVDAWQPPGYWRAALQYLSNSGPIQDANVLRTALMLIASVRKLQPQIKVDSSEWEVVLGIIVQHASGSFEQRHMLIDGGALLPVFDFLKSPSSVPAPCLYMMASCCLVSLLLPPADQEMEVISREMPSLFGRVLSASFAYAPNDKLPLPLYNFARGVVGYPSELGSDERVLEEGQEARFISETVDVMLGLMRYGMSEGSSGLGSAACDDANSWWHHMLRLLREVAKNSAAHRQSAVSVLLDFCDSHIGRRNFMNMFAAKQRRR